MNEEDVKAGYVHQHAIEVVDFSSQYGYDGSMSYVASNLAGPPNVFPGYGDFTQACVFRTYGPWWKSCPSARKPINRAPITFRSQDYIELLFEERVYPSRIDIFETYNPGSVVKILACNTSPKDFEELDPPEDVEWATLWAGQPESLPARPREFSPPLNPCPFATNLIRLEVNQKLLEYYTELDAVKLYGILECKELQNSSDHPSRHLYPDPGISATEKMLRDLMLVDKKSAPGNNGYFDILPSEVIQLILSYLDMPSLCSAALSCSFLMHHCYDPLQYTDLDLQPYWSQVDDYVLKCLQIRCSHLQQLSLSWCGRYDMIKGRTFNEFLEHCGSELTCLRLACSRFLYADCLRAVGVSCPLLQELDLSSCTYLHDTAFQQVANFTSLRRLNLYRTSVVGSTVRSIIRNNPGLEYLNLGGCKSCDGMDDVAIDLAQHCPQLKAVDFWRCRSLTNIGLRALASGCSLLLELDLGWCPELRSNTGCFVSLAQSCHLLKKLFVTANRTVSDNDLFALAKHCRDLEQLDILGTRMVSPDGALAVLNSCKKLSFFDISFCSQLDFAMVYKWKMAFPDVALRKSFQNT
ncbi:F-box/LRR-repeat protein 4-like [Branchiostoma floridae]|uniref:F-box/LRR-repeat protein 4-like n=1 Tax=Branchiostoma floridae TaxID=7739 RepID=A0A9J7MPG8_BRAFL|nr:F-box/LRR-repeat protein 4-like [Branchiostoma floridae]